VEKYLKYDSVTVNGNDFERLWPARKKSLDRQTRKLLRRAAKLGVSPAIIKKLREA
jgi:hypothetical protein